MERLHQGQTANSIIAAFMERLHQCAAKLTRWCLNHESRIQKLLLECGSVHYKSCLLLFWKSSHDCSLMMETGVTPQYQRGLGTRTISHYSRLVLEYFALQQNILHCSRLELVCMSGTAQSRVHHTTNTRKHHAGAASARKIHRHNLHQNNLLLDIFLSLT